jgi:crotonobetainyl-CoA:carnitine CoA-transferase CaiB-like acyl-CoA transferase
VIAMTGPLHGIRVIDMTSVAMGPYATQIMGDMGADVIKVESPEGDVFRYAAPARHTGMGAAFINFNRNKRSVMLDLKQPEALQSLLALVAQADVLVYNVRPRSMKKLGLDYETLRALNPRLVYCGAYGFSEKGRYAGRPAFDDIIQAMSGLAAVQTNPVTNEPAYVNTILADKTAGLTVAYSVAMALFERTRSGEGQSIEVPMFETMVSFGMLEHLAGSTFEPAEGPMGYQRLMSKWRRPYRTADGFIALMPYTTAQWQRFFTLAGRPDVAQDPRFMDPSQRSQNINTLYGMLADVVAQQSTAVWLERLATADIPHSEVFSLDTVLADPHLADAGMVLRHDHPSEGALNGIGIPVTFSRTPGTIRRLAPTLGEHSAADIAAEWMQRGDNAQ